MSTICRVYCHRILNYSMLICALLFVNSCSFYEKGKLRFTIMREYGKKLDFSWQGYQVLSDTLIPDYKISKPITIISYIDGDLCPECFSNYLNAAQMYVEQFKSDSIQFVCVAYPRPIDELQYALTLYELNPSDVMVVYDSNNDYLKKNSITKLSSGYNAFLIDKNHKIVLLGDPIRNQAMYDLCKSQIESMLCEL